MEDCRNSLNYYPQFVCQDSDDNDDDDKESSSQKLPSEAPCILQHLSIGQLPVC